MSDAVDAERGNIRAAWGADYSVLAATAGFLVVLLFAMPASPWEFDEPLFFQALHKYDPVAHHPPPPGYPVFIGVGKVFRLFIPSDFAVMAMKKRNPAIRGIRALLERAQPTED